MLVRNCAGGVVFCGDKVLLLKNEKGEWVLPKGVIRNGEVPSEVALRRVKEEAGVTAEIVSTAGRTNYEFYSVTRQKPVCNKIIWYVMKSPNESCSLNKDYDFTEVGYFDIEKALELVTYSQDRSLIHLSYMKIKEYSEEENTIASDAVLNGTM
ncbi:NUDIX hydrolase [Clostridium thermosuccinogenes]|uniref:NUDIX hydrolase n=1 Tax=Clostridium thermosuccinogenes TaxID=84032 RepID=A0A2K2FDB3_9CLOT|nr:NUDIX hydrolase [Pseudoclostridium thermosuccinogenes]AUS95215.1 NUDIX hydrolase [Pseudoclostridium thermosuccinogenes]PNT91593.1 NUDIX hydrolase [Pseudoclostridium thermosuccinogenes]PNT96773.1 NUDIX hydrolase [Pseudoclostridium thermosuccinogenes]PNT98610.1 NUDIX hydrolase [Pseudoclostridium thermosuccinogenes]